MGLLDNVPPILFILFGMAIVLAREPIRKVIFPKLPPKRGHAIVLTVAILLELFAIFAVVRYAYRTGQRRRSEASGATSELYEPSRCSVPHGHGNDYGA